VQEGHYEEALGIIDNLDHSLRYEGMLYKSKILELTGYYKQALKIALESLAHYENSIAPSFMLNAIVAIAYVYWRLNKYDKALEYVTNGEKRLENNKNSIDAEILEQQGALSNVKGLILWKVNNFPDALACFFKSLQLRTQQALLLEQSYTLNNIGNTYLSMGELVKAEHYYGQSLELRKKLNNKPGLAASFTSYARLQEEKKNYTLALQFHLQSLNLWQELKNKQFIAKSLRFIGKNYLMQGNKDKAEEYLQQSLHIFEKLQNDVDIIATRQILKELLIK
jgi:tetratricopeptide (TPR) repeat protein